MTRQPTVFRLADYQQSKTVYFDRRELNELLSLYSRYVIRGLWRDYAIDHRDGFALFSVFRHSQESPVFCIMKCAAGGNRSGDFLVFSGREKPNSGKTLADALAIFRKRAWLTVARSP